MKRRFLLGLGWKLPLGAAAAAVLAACGDGGSPAPSNSTKPPSADPNPVNDPAYLGRINNARDPHWQDPFHRSTQTPAANGTIRLDATDKLFPVAERAWIDAPGEEPNSQTPALTFSNTRTLVFRQRVRIESLGAEGVNGVGAGRIFLALRADEGVSSSNVPGATETRPMTNIVALTNGARPTVDAGAFNIDGAPALETWNLTGAAADTQRHAIREAAFDVKVGDELEVGIAVGFGGARMVVRNLTTGGERFVHTVPADRAGTVALNPMFGVLNGAIATFSPLQVEETPFGFADTLNVANLAIGTLQQNPGRGSSVGDNFTTA